MSVNPSLCGAELVNVFVKVRGLYCVCCVCVVCACAHMHVRDSVYACMRECAHVHASMHACMCVQLPSHSKL